MNLLKLILLSSPIIFSIQYAYAVCSPDPTFQTFSTSINMGRVLVKPSDAIGKVVAFKTFSFAPLTTVINGRYLCVPPTMNTIFVASLINNGSLSVLANNIYNTNIPGIGIRIKHNMLDFPNSNFNDYYPYSKGRTTAPIAIWVMSAGFLGVEIIKTSTANGSGALRSGNYTSLYIEPNQAKPWFYGVMSSNGTTIASSSCEILGLINRTMIMPTITKSQLAGVGTTLGETGFDINVLCNGAVSSTIQTSTNNIMRVDFSAESNNTKLLKNTAPLNPATGVALQLVVTEQSVDRILGKADTIKVGSTQSNQLQQMTIPFKVRYYQTQATVSPGEVQAQATLSFDYL